jgi:hypothetical protein
LILLYKTKHYFKKIKGKIELKGQAHVSNLKGKNLSALFIFFLKWGEDTSTIQEFFLKAKHKIDNALSTPTNSSHI